MILVDVSGSMGHSLSSKSDLSRMDAASALATIVPSENKRIFSFSEKLVECPNDVSISNITTINESQRNVGTYLRRTMEELNNKVKYDRLIVITDEQSNDGVGSPMCDKAYMINVSTEKVGVGYGSEWINISGFSENVIRYIQEYESLE